MKEGKHFKRKFKIIEVYSMLLFIAILFMCIGYAKISGMVLSINGTLEVALQEGVFITTMSNISETPTNSNINYFIQSMFESRIELQNDIGSTETYEVTLYNSSNKQYVYIGTMTDTTDEILYDNENIEFSTPEIEQYVTIIEPKQYLKFKITFKYKEDANISKNILNCKLNFRFKEIPKIELSNEGQTYNLNDIYPDYPSQTYQFTVKNYIGDDINNVPLKYHFDVDIDKPLTAKIYDENNNEVTGNISFDENLQTKAEHEYTLKIIWDDSNEDGTLKYDSSKYELRDFSCNVKFIATVDDEKYLDFSINKEFDVNITSGDYKDSYEILYINIPNYDYPIEVAQGEGLEITFVKEIPGDVEVIGVESYTYNRPTLVIDNVITDVEITNTTGELIAFEHAGEYVFAGNNYIDTQAAMFSEENVDRNFIVTFEIVADDQNQAAYNTLISAMDESGSPFPGFVFRIGDSSRLTKFQLTANSAKGKGNVFYSERTETYKVDIVRIDGVIYVKTNDGNYQLLLDYDGFVDHFEGHLTIGAALNSSNKPFRYFRGTLANIKVAFLDNGASQDIISELNSTFVFEENSVMEQEVNDTTVSEIGEIVVSENSENIVLESTEINIGGN